MNITLGTGELSLNGETFLTIGSCEEDYMIDGYTPNIEPILSANEQAEFSCSMTLDKYSVDALCNYDYAPTNTFTMKYDVPIMIQARWHKRPRIRKKWLKRYGMKPDTVAAECIANALSATPIDNDYSSIEFTTDALTYRFRQDQLRRGIKIRFI